MEKLAKREFPTGFNYVLQLKKYRKKVNDKAGKISAILK
jgi:hypothetical protein